MRYLKGTKNKCLCYGKGAFELTGFCDSDMAGDVDTRKSTSGYVFTLARGAVSWCSRLQKIVALSTIEAEYISGIEASKEAIWLARLCSDFGLPDKAPMEVKTRVIRNDLNPKWNEELTLAVPDPPLPLKLSVLDRDLFKADDKMGNAEIDLRTLVAAAKLKAGLQFQEGMNIRKIVATKENHFATDSVIKFKDGHIVQEICIKLQNVEKGQIELELRWQPRDP
ncbi:hypothetical protein L7F22_050139 [Adiantum nelumboides]|nr:hypothetical protein [Adiantum nelumboides]